MEGTTLDRFLRLVDRVSAFCAAVAAIFLAAIAAVMLAEIFVRYFLGTSLLFTWEYASYLMAAMFFWGAAYTLNTGGHVRVGILLETVPARIRTLLEIVATAIGVAVTVLIATALVDLAWQSHSRGVRSFTPQQTYLAVPHALAAIGACMLCLQMMVRFVRVITGRRPERDLPDISSGST